MKITTNELGHQSNSGHSQKLQKKWEPKYALAVRPWLVHWDNLKIFLLFQSKFNIIQ
jgi:hypothetical protein